MKRMLALLALLAPWGPTAAPAQSPKEPAPIALAIRPAGPPRPALKYRLVPERLTLVPGNAAIFYHRAVQMASWRRNRLDAEQRANEPPPARRVGVDEQVSRWNAAPIAEIPIDQARAVLESFQSPLKEIEQGAMRATCEWEFDHRPEGMYLPIEEIQEMRFLARLAMLQARLAILDGKTDEAFHWIETGLVMGRHVSQGPTIIQALVGVAIDSVTAKCLEDLIQAPGMPSLYWALADRPRPFIDMRGPFEGERHLLEKEIPGFLELDRGPWGIDQARKFADELQRKLFSFETGHFDGGMAHRLGIAAMIAKIYPEARRALIARGRPEAEVEAMPVVQVASLYCYQEYRRLLDESYKWMNLPHWQSVGRVDAPFIMAERKLADPMLRLFLSLTPALSASRLAAVRLDRQLDALQCVEAIRLHAAGHGGKLPESLESITEAPVPLDPATGKPFAYSVDGDSATLSAPLPPGGPDHPSYRIRYSMKLAR